MFTRRTKAGGHVDKDAPVLTCIFPSLRYVSVVYVVVLSTKCASHVTPTLLTSLSRCHEYCFIYDTHAVSPRPLLGEKSKNRAGEG